jgi:hypothetical protein
MAFPAPPLFRARLIASGLTFLAIFVLALSQSFAGDKPAKAADNNAAKAGEAKKADQDEPKYLRVLHDDNGDATALETAIVRFRKADGTGPTVDLIGAVHIADKPYYEQLNRDFAKYDAVLYELVAKKGTRVPKGGRKGADSILSSVQKGMKSMLELSFQLDDVDYTAKNLVHADLSPEEFAQSMKDNNESVTQMFMRMLTYGMSKQGKADDDGAKLLMALFDKNRALMLKRTMADQFANMDDAMAVLSGPNGSTLIQERNKRALAVLKTEMASGKQKLAIFYGAGHMSDMQKRLEADFHLKPASTRWLRAWNMEEKK